MRNKETVMKYGVIIIHQRTGKLERTGDGVLWWHFVFTVSNSYCIPSLLYCRGLKQVQTVIGGSLVPDDVCMRDQILEADLRNGPDIWRVVHTSFCGTV